MRAEVTLTHGVRGQTLARSGYVTCVKELQKVYRISFMICVEDLRVP
jgi:hypothetical protein